MKLKRFYVTLIFLNLTLNYEYRNSHINFT